MTVLRALGLMSGTSMDGVDVALIDTDGESGIHFGPHGSFPYSAADRIVLRGALADAVDLDHRDARPGGLAEAETLITDRHAEAVEAFLAAHDIAPASIAMVGFHGQTVLHRPEKNLTVQIGHGQDLAARLGIAVAWDFRADDVAGHGQGAPLVPVYHRALADQARLGGPLVVINIGGVANLSFIAHGRDPIACDTGPGNALLDDLVLERTGQPFDRDGMLSSAGSVDEVALAALLDHPFFALPAPKSLDRNAFSLDAVAGLATVDAAATLAAFTAASIVLAVEAMPELPERAIVCGGGGHNPAIMEALAARLPCRLVSATDMGWSIDAMEAQAFAYLAVRRSKNLPITFPGTTGIAAPLTGGRISLP
ncbi:anhydro-N-acetylmuramic acid kinase [Beijerinckia sp. L45]|uniref:anhydro-N-acetylmuramic acid kinase n=1 Tax=Beijerinckia sp. L45 TaxID=1641855 RepID=UPI0015766036|nr:anhydro-N-acetylmuramic acid kinase [Beijerinckia sp. L45]